MVPVITASSHPAGSTLGKCPQVQQHPDGGMPEHVNVAGRPQANLGRDTEHLRVHDCEVVARQELIDRQLRSSALPRQRGTAGTSGCGAGSVLMTDLLFAQPAPTSMRTASVTIRRPSESTPVTSTLPPRRPRTQSPRSHEQRSSTGELLRTARRRARTAFMRGLRTSTVVSGNRTERRISHAGPDEPQSLSVTGTPDRRVPAESAANPVVRRKWLSAERPVIRPACLWPLGCRAAVAGPRPGDPCLAGYDRDHAASGGALRALMTGWRSRIRSVGDGTGHDRCHRAADQPA